MDIAVDASALIAVIANEPQRDALIEATRGADLIAPLSVHWEIGNAFSAMLRRKRISLPAALEALDAYTRIPVRFVDVELDECLRIAAALGTYAYDAYLIRCGLKYRAPILSLDAGLLAGARAMKAEVLEVLL